VTHYVMTRPARGETREHSRRRFARAAFAASPGGIMLPKPAEKIKSLQQYSRAARQPWVDPIWLNCVGSMTSAAVPVATSWSDWAPLEVTVG